MGAGVKVQSWEGGGVSSLSWMERASLVLGVLFRSCVVMDGGWSECGNEWNNNGVSLMETSVPGVSIRRNVLPNKGSRLAWFDWPDAGAAAAASSPGVRGPPDVCNSVSGDARWEIAWREDKDVCDVDGWMDGLL